MVNSIQCPLDAIEAIFLRLQARAFAKDSLYGRTYLVCTSLNVLIRKQPKYGEGEKVSRKGSQCSTS